MWSLTDNGWERDVDSVDSYEMNNLQTDQNCDMLFVMDKLQMDTFNSCTQDDSSSEYDTAEELDGGHWSEKEETAEEEKEKNSSSTSVEQEAVENDNDRKKKSDGQGAAVTEIKSLKTRLLLWKNRRSRSLECHSVPECEKVENKVDTFSSGAVGHGKGSQGWKRVVPEQDALEVQKSLTLAMDSIPRNRSRGSMLNFDTVAVSFWIAELREGCYLSKLRYPGDKFGKRRKYTVTIDRDGSISLFWRRISLLGSTDHRADLVSTEILDSNGREFRMDTSAGDIFVRAYSDESFELWTQGMSFIFSYSRALSHKRSLEYKEYGY